MELIGLIPVAPMALIWYLLKQKDDKQAKDIELLYNLHRSNEIKIAELRLDIATDHYPKSELDPKFDRLETAITSGLAEINRDLGNRFDRLSEALLRHIASNVKG